ncbi:ClbS/DfsB family four-helix bundle protein [Lacticaseibacillus daqingensis]|uniref:ClbS/DfsB family four-helix bundle protein n=1 Tax=Lacticaseibacillus daqingensis TaxID=2486014 RepID=UPI000F76D1C6|nr:ClbS/DfsB family four-helix bundle protein [Lacticaseibacillus daqingensis]
MKPQSRQELILSAYQQHDRLDALIDGLTPKAQAQAFPFKGRDHDLRDVLVQLAVWQQLYLAWSTANLAGTPQRFLPKPYTWASCGKLSQKIQASHQTMTLAAARQAYETSDAAIMTQLEDLTNEQLYLPHFYRWTGSMRLGDYAALVTAQHAAWAVKVVARAAHQMKPLPA